MQATAESERLGILIQTNSETSRLSTRSCNSISSPAAGECGFDCRLAFLLHKAPPGRVLPVDFPLNIEPPNVECDPSEGKCTSNKDPPVTCNDKMSTAILCCDCVDERS